MTGAVEARLVGDDTVTFAVVLEHIVTSCMALPGQNAKHKKKKEKRESKIEHLKMAASAPFFEPKEDESSFGKTIEVLG